MVVVWATLKTGYRNGKGEDKAANTASIAGSFYRNVLLLKTCL